LNWFKGAIDISDKLLITLLSRTVYDRSVNVGFESNNKISLAIKRGCGLGESARAIDLVIVDDLP